MPSTLPEPDPEGFIGWVRNSYTDNRWSTVYQRDRSVTVWSGECPSFPRFQQDLRPRLHTHGFVITETRTSVPKKIDGGMEHVHWVAACPIAEAVAEAEGLLCARSACRELVDDAESDHCADCEPIMEAVHP